MKGHRLLAIILTLTLLLAPSPAYASSPEIHRPSAENQLPTSPALAGIPLQARLKIDPDLLKQLLDARQDVLNQHKPLSRITYLVYLREQAPLSDLMASPNRLERRQRLVERLQSTAQSTQAGLVSYLDQRLREGAISRYQSYWVFNGLAVDGDLETAIQLALRPEVESIRPNRTRHLPAPAVKTPPQSDTGPEWGVARIRADRVWQEFGVTGAGVVVANIDSGVDWTHPALQRKYRGYNPMNPAASTHDYNWIDFTRTYTNAPGPNRGRISNVSDHGTHTMGTMVGSDPTGQNLIGVAPGAKWIAVKAFSDQGDATDENIHAAFQWCLAPTDLNGRNPDPRKAPDIVNNSWGDDNSRDETFRRDVIAMRAAGIFCTFSAGNAGPNSGTVGSPASFPEAFAVGATNTQDVIASFSARGPSPWGEIKPDVSAPGVDIRSSIAGGSYERGWNGTSMAVPHVAGLAALLLQASRIAGAPATPGEHARAGLDITNTEQIITSTALDLGNLGADNAYGYGRIDAYQAVGAVIRSGTFAGRVTEEGTGVPIANVLIVMHNLATGGQASTQSRTDGSYSFAVAQGMYNVTASKFGYRNKTVQSVQVLANTTTQLDFSLSPLASGIIRGRVTRSSDGQPVPATVQLPGTPAQVLVDGQGYYALTAPAGTYTVRAVATQPGYRGAEITNVTLNAGATVVLNLSLTPAPRMLLVDADAWRSSTTIGYYRSALDNLLYSYDTWTILDPPADNPSASKLAEYEIVIWSQPKTSPGYIQAWGSLAAYLDRGGRLFISGEDIGYWDRQGEAAAAYRNYLHASYLRDDGGMTSLAGVKGDILEGTALDFNTADSARNQTAPDALAPSDALARPIIASRAGTLFGLRADSCRHRVVYLGFGLEGMGPQPAREQLLARAITWLAADRPAQGVSLYLPSSSLAGALNSNVIYDVVVMNDGKTNARFRLSAESPSFPVRLINPTTGQTITETPLMTPCATLPLRLLVTIPKDAAPGKTEVTIVRVVSSVPGAPDLATRSVQTIALAPWGRVANLPTPRYRLGGAVRGCALYTFGGLLNDESGTITNTVEILNLRSQTWSNGAPKPTIAANYATTQLGDLVYLIGGWNPKTSTEFLSCVEVYDLTANRWSAAMPLPKPLAGMSAAALGGKVYAFGGRGKDGSSRATYIYDPQARTWSQGAMLPMDVSYGQAVSLGGFIYLAGGWPNSADLLRYDPASDSWAILTPMRVGRQGFAMAAANGFLYVAGGGNEWNGLTSVERYDPANDSWTELLPLRFGDRAGSTGVFVDGRFYVLGGTSAAAGAIESLDLDRPLGGSSFTTASQAKVGDTLRYTLLLRNPGPTGVRATWRHALPGVLEYVQGSITGGATYDPARRELIWTGDLAASTALSFTFFAIVSPRATDGIIITSTLTADAGGCTPTELAAVTQVFIPNLSRSILQVDKAEAAPGDELRYTINVINSSPFTISNASLTARIPGYTTLVPESLIGATYNAAHNRLEWMGTLPPAQTAEPTFQWIDATGGQLLPLSDDSCLGPLDLGFEFVFYGRRYSSIYVNSNGMVLFEGCSQAYRNEAIPSSSQPNGFVAPFWDDLIPSDGNVYMAILGRAPNRYAVVEWYNVTFYGQTDRQTFEVILYEGSNRIIFQYLDVNGSRGAGRSATVGIENQQGSEGILYLLDGEPSDHLLRDELAIEMIQPSTNRAAVHKISYAVRVHELLPPFTIISNTAIMTDAYATYERTVTTTIYSPSLAGSSKTVLPSRALSGDTVTYRLNLVNSGRAAATNLYLTDVLPAGVTYVPGSLRGAGVTYNPDERRIEWRGTLAAGATAETITYQATVNEGLPINQWITNTATISIQGMLIGRLQAGLLVNEINLTTSDKSASASEVVAGAPITYRITLRNTGLATAENVTMRDQLSSMTRLVPGSLVGGTYDSERGAIVWAGALGPRGEHVVSYRVDTDANLRNGTLIMNGVSLDDGQSPPFAFTAVTRVLRGDLSSSDMVASPAWVAPGGVVTITIRLRNTGPIPIAGRLRYRPPNPLEAVPGTAYASAGTITQREQEINWEGTILPQAMVILRLQVTVPLGTPRQAVNNQATLTDAGGIEKTLQTTIIVDAYLTFFPLAHKSTLR